MPISAQQWRVAVGRVNASRSFRPRMTGQPKMKLTLTSLDIPLFILTTLLGAILSNNGGRKTGERKCVSRGIDGGGTVGEMAPSLLTAPRRKELLVLAGDVETNPGPYTDYTHACRLRESDLELVVEELRGVEEKWRLIGMELGRSIPGGVRVDDIKYPDRIDCLREVIRRWLQSIYITTRKTIIGALRKAGEAQVADSLKAKYIPDLLDESDLDLLTRELKPAQHKWESIGDELPHFFSAYHILRRYSDDGDRLREILRGQLQFYTTTWRNIVDTLRSPYVGESQLADELEAKYCPNLLTASLVAQELTAVYEKWQYIGQELGVKQSSLRYIHTNYSDPGDCLWRALSKQFERCATTWKDIVAVLRTPRIGESHLADHLDVKYCSSAQQILQDALEKGYVDCHIWKVLVTGAAGSGKTTLKHRLFGEDPPSLRCSTALAEAAIRAISREIVGTSETGWFRVTYEELMKMLGGALKAGVPMEKSPPEVRVHNQPTTFTAHYSEQAKGVTVSVGRSPKPSTKTTAVYPVVSSTQSGTAKVSPSKQELVQLVQKSQGSKRFLELQWIHFIDSGGQPQFHEVLPAFIRNTTATIFVTKLSESLDEHPMIEYFDEKGKLCGKPYRHALSNHQMLQCCVRTILSRPSTKEGKHSRLFVVGTHRDCESRSFHSESRIQKNKILLNMLKPLKDRLVYYRLSSEVIFPINAKTPTEQDQQVCAKIRKVVEDKKCTPPHYKIPIGWFLLEQDIVNAAKGGVISRKECHSIAGILGIKEKALKAALEYFHDLNIFLYYPSILPDVVFSNPQIPLDKVTELVHFSYSLHSDSPPIALEGEWLQFRDKGIVTLEMFQDERFSAHYTPTSFTPSDLIKLFEHLLIIAPLFNTTYFMPSLLAMVSPEEVSKYLPPPSSSAAPLLVHFPAGCAQNGVFCALVVYLISKCQWEMECNPEGAPLCASRSCVHFQLPGKPVSIVLIDTFSYFEVHVTTRNTMYPKVCPMLREAIFSGLKAAAEALKYNNSTPVPAFFCKCSSPPHAATPVISDDDCYLMCTKCSSSGTLTKQHSVWLDETIHIRDTVDGVDSVAPATNELDLDHPPLSEGGDVKDELQKCHITEGTASAVQSTSSLPTPACSSSRTGAASTPQTGSPLLPQTPPTSKDITLSEKDLLSITDYLLDLEKSHIYNLGVVLGLKQTKVKTLKDSDTFLDDVITAWLRKEDQVAEKGEPSWTVLVNALKHRRVGQTGIAKTITNNHLGK